MNKNLIKLKKLILNTAVNHNTHLPSAFSILDIIWVLYDQVLNINKNNINDDKRDRFILSKAHGCLALYAVLVEKDFFPPQELTKFACYNGMLGCHPDRLKVPGIEASTGSLGHGLPISLGVALALKIKKNIISKVYALIGDGEANEGTIWESALLASHHKLNNLYCIIDHNHSTDRALVIDDVAAKFKAFGWNTITINGHNHFQIYKALTQKSPKPLAIIAKTVKGHGCRILENNPAWHHRILTREELPLLIKQLY